MGGKIKYVLTGKGFEEMFGLICRNPADRYALEKIGLRHGEVDCNLTVIEKGGRIYNFNRGIDKSGFSSYSGVMDYSPDGLNFLKLNKTNIKEAAESIRKDIEWNRKRDINDNRAVVHGDYEELFKQVAEALGMKPEKMEGVF